MKKGDANDPLLLQCLPLSVEDQVVDGYTTDPLQESSYMQGPGILQKYHGRVLLTVTGACAIHCRYCFRRHFPYAEANPAAGRFEETLAWLREQEDVSEIILSGGDPLSLDDDKLGRILQGIDRLPRIRTLRLHTRLPVVIPERIDAAFLGNLEKLSSRVVVVIHANHANEIDDHVRQAMGRLRRAGATLLNQSVLLRSINDSATALAALGEALFAAGVLPYYLHQLDPVQGASHFAVNDARALKIIASLRARLPGYLVPRLVREEPGGAAKTPL